MGALAARDSRNRSLHVFVGRSEPRSTDSYPMDLGLHDCRVRLLVPTLFVCVFAIVALVADLIGEDFPAPADAVAGHRDARVDLVDEIVRMAGGTARVLSQAQVREGLQLPVCLDLLEVTQFLILNVISVVERH